MKKPSDFLWVEKYKPNTIDECILPNRIKKTLSQYVETGQIENYIAVGSPGCGKTSSAKALLNELNIQHLFINASSEGNVDTIRNKVVRFASTKSILSNYKVIVLDECDYLSLNAQAALRGIIEEFAVNCRFILTANYENKITDALKSRCPVIDFNFSKNEKKEMLKAFLPRVADILKDNDVSFNNKDMVNFVVARFPDFRKTLKLLQRNVEEVDGKKTLVINYLGSDNDEKIDNLVDILCDRDFDKMSEWVAQNIDNEGHLIRKSLYDKMFDRLADSSIPTLVLILNDYDRYEVQVKDIELHMKAMCVTIMQECEFKNES